MRPTIYIDADACPVTSETLAVARKNALPAVVAGDFIISTQQAIDEIKESS